VGLRLRAPARPARDRPAGRAGAGPVRGRAPARWFGRASLLFYFLWVHVECGCLASGVAGGAGRRARVLLPWALRVCRMWAAPSA
jgi:hypothetical protein